MSELVEFLRARLAEDEERARFVQREQGDRVWHEAEPWRLSWHDEYDLLCIEPSRMLADVEAKRRLIASYLAACEDREAVADLRGPRGPIERVHATARHNALREAIELAALPYASHPDYRDEWRPA